MRKALALVAANIYNMGVDTDDFVILNEMLTSSGKSPESKIGLKASGMIKTGITDEEQEVHNLRLATIRTLTKITHIHHAGFSLTPSIGRLQNLKVLDLYHANSTSVLPDEIGNMVNLTKLKLWNTNIESLPPSIGRLTNLKEFCFFGASPLLLELPEEIGDLVGLEDLELSSSKIVSLPASIARLQNLKSLCLCLNLNLQSLPDEIGQLHNLRHLKLSLSKRLTKLPREIGKLENLECLGLIYSGIASLPESMERLQRLTHLGVWGVKMPQLNGENAEEFLLTLAHRHRSLVSFSVWCKDIKVAYALQCNAIRHLLPLAVTPGLWPLMLHAATRGPIVFQNRWVSADSMSRQFGNIPTPDVVYGLLSEGREAFLRLLIHRHHASVAAGPEQEGIWRALLLDPWRGLSCRK